jgi:hypothetical protein
MRIFDTLANSVLSERSFSAINMIQSKKRNRLSIAKMSKLCYVYLNKKYLRKKKTKYYEISYQEELQLENIIYELETLYVNGAINEIYDSELNAEFEENDN